MIDIKRQTAQCDWVGCLHCLDLHAPTLRDAQIELKKHGWRASAILDKMTICPNHVATYHVARSSRS